MTDQPPSRALRSLLVVDDDLPFRARVIRALGERQFEVSGAGDYEQAMSLARVDSPELALVDLRLPGKSGLELVRDLKALDPTTNVRYRLIEGTVESIMGRPVFIGLRYKVDAETPTTDRLPDDVRKMLESIK